MPEFTMQVVRRGACVELSLAGPALSGKTHMVNQLQRLGYRVFERDFGPGGGREWVRFAVTPRVLNLGRDLRELGYRLKEAPTNVFRVSWEAEAAR